MRGKAGTETKIVKVAPKKSEQVEEPKVVVKAAAIRQTAPPDRMQKKTRKAADGEDRRCKTSNWETCYFKGFRQQAQTACRQTDHSERA